MGKTLTLTITLSGPKHSEQQARNALAAERFDVLPDSHDYGLPAATEGQAEAFINVHGDDVDKAWDAVRSLGWNLRLHHEKPEPAKPNPFQVVDERIGHYDSKLAELEARLARVEGNHPPMAGGAVESPGFANQNSTYGAEQTRRAIASLFQRGSSIGSITGGIVGSGDCTLTPPGSGMSVNVAPGEVWVPGSSAATQSGYYCRVSSSTSLSIAAADPTNPRIDRVSAIVTDSAYSGGTNTFAVAVETGTPTAGATLINLNGAAAAPASSYTLGYVLAPNGATNIVSADISNVATFSSLGISAAWAARGGTTTIATSQSTSSTSYTTLTTPDQVTGIVLPTNGLIAVWYQATWQESVSGAARAAIFLGSNQVATGFGTGPGLIAAATSSGGAGIAQSLCTAPFGLVTTSDATNYTGDLTTGQFVGQAGNYSFAQGGSSPQSDAIGSTNFVGVGGPAYIFAAAGTYIVSVQFKASSGSVTASNRKMWAQALAFA